MVQKNPRKSLLVINQYYHPDRASTGQLLTELCEELSNEFDVTALVGTPSYSVSRINPLGTEENRTAVNVIRAFNTRFSRKGIAGRLINYLSFMIFATLRALFLRKRDIILVMSDPPTVNFIGYIVKKIKGGKLVQICQDIYPELAQSLKKADNAMLLRIFSAMNRAAQKSSDGLIAIGDGMKEKLTGKGLPNDKIEVIENWIDTELVKPESRENKFRDENALSSKFIVEHSGNIGLSQNLDLLIESADILKETRDILFLIIGDGAEKENLKKTVKARNLENVLFLPYQEKKKIKYSLSSADIHFVSLRRGLKGLIVPSKIYGIMAVARPVIACLEDEDDVLKLINGINFGIRADYDANSIAKAILYFYNDRHLIGEYGDRAREAVLERNSKRLILDRYRNYLLKI